MEGSPVGRCEKPAWKRGRGFTHLLPKPGYGGLQVQWLWVAVFSVGLRLENVGLPAAWMQDLSLPKSPCVTWGKSLQLHVYHCPFLWTDCGLCLLFWSIYITGPKGKGSVSDDVWTEPSRRGWWWLRGNTGMGATISFRLCCLFCAKSRKRVSADGMAVVILFCMETEIGITPGIQPQEAQLPDWFLKLINPWLHSLC